MELQIALDRLSLDRALEIAAIAAGVADWIEVGTSMIKQYGTRAISEVVAAAGSTPVLADTKTVDDAEFELGLVFDAGAASATVVGLAPPATLAAALRVVDERNRELMVDLIGLSAEQRAALANRLPSHVILAAHVGKDAQSSQPRATGLLGSWATGRRVAIAGGLTAKDLSGLGGDSQLRAIVGSAVTGAPEPSRALRELREALQTEGQGHAC